MRIVVISGIWPPDVGGPASHAPEVAEELTSRGHQVEAVTMADREPAPEPYAVHWASRRLPIGVRHLRAAALIGSQARHADVVYSTGLVGRSALGTTLARTPLVLKLTSDPTYERSIRFGLTGRDLASYQHQGGIWVKALRLARDLALRRAAHIVCPSASLRDLAIGWGLAPGRVTVLPNPVSAPADLGEQAELRRRHGLNGPTLVYAGRLSVQKAVDVALEALAKTPEVSLVIAGDGPDAELLRRRAQELPLDGRARFVGPQPRQAVFELLRAADAAVLSSEWENFPHMLVEALAVGTPVIATETGGVVEIVEDGRNGLLVPPGDADALASSIERFFGDEGLQERLRSAAVGSVAEYSPVRIYDRLEQILVEAAA
jgi:glycosyltransferase involved in cell wall biosynthesis